MFTEEFEEKVLDSIHKYDLIHNGDKIIVAVSGGPDSVCMMRILANLQPKLNVELIPAHVNYHTRGEDSDLDEKLCRRLAEDLGLILHIRSGHVEGASSPAVQRSGNFQREARRLRYDFFKQLCRDHGANKIAVGHTDDDVVETTLMHFLRGSGISGLGGIYPASGRTIRPVIDCSRDEIVEYLELKGIEFRTDRTNIECKYFRNKIRNELLPYLQDKYNPQIKQALLNIAHLARQTEQFIACQVECAWRRAVRHSRMGKILIDLDKYNEADTIIRYGLLRKAYRMFIPKERESRSLDFKRVENANRLAVRNVGTREDLKNGVIVERGYNEIVVFRNEDIRFREEINFPGIHSLDRLYLEISGEIADYSGDTGRIADNWSVSVDLDKAPAPYMVRSVEKGDRVRLLNAPGARKLSDIFIDKKISRSLRPEIPVITARGKIIWIAGIGIANNVKITQHTTRVLKLSVKTSVKQKEDD